MFWYSTSRFQQMFQVSFKPLIKYGACSLLVSPSFHWFPLHYQRLTPTPALSLLLLLHLGSAD